MVDEHAGSALRGRDLAGLGALLVGAVVGGLVIGYAVDAQAGTSPLWTLVGITVGVVAGAFAFALRVRAALRE